MGIGAAILRDGEAAPDLAAAASIEVYECLGHPTTYRIRFAADIDDGDLPLLKDDRLSVGTELSIVVDVGGTLSCLVKGPVHAQEIHLEHGGAGSYLDVLGADTTITMDRESKATLWSDVTDSDAVSSIAEQYAFETDVESTSPSHSEDKHTLVQRETDLAFVRRLARRNGYLFWVTCDEDGNETAHFRRPQLDAEPAAELTLNRTPPTIDALTICWDAERPVRADAVQVDLNTKDDIDGAVDTSPLSSLGTRAFHDVAAGTQTLHLAAPVDDAGDLRARAEAALIEAGFFIRATCATTTTALRTVLRSHTLVRLSGVGSRHSGRYLCASVRHLIDAEAHRMETMLLRNAWGT